MFLTTDQIGEQMQLNRKTVLRHLRAGVIHGNKIGRVWRVPESELKRLCRHNRSCRPNPPESDTVPKQQHSYAPEMLAAKK